jgi:TRAP-type mannitol/chloroaromatic compound transport system substrate-binding protein
MMTSLGKTIAAVVVGGAFALSAVADADAQERVRWKMHSAFGGKLVGLGTAGVHFSQSINKLSQGNIEIKFFEPGALVPGLQGFDSVSVGSIEASWNSAGYHAGKEPSGAFYTAVPFGPQVQEFLAWMYHGGGYELQKEIYAKYNVHPRTCNYIAPESSGWFRKEIKSLDDLKGLKMRFFGLGAKVIERYGVSTQLLAAGDIYPALELGTLDATEFSNPAIDLNLGFHQIAKHYYFPGWHQQATFVELQVNMDKWKGLTDHQRYLIETACDATLHFTIGESEAAQADALATIASKGVTLHRWPDDVLKKFEVSWQEVIAEESAKDANFKKIADSLYGFRKKYATWKNLGFIN